MKIFEITESKVEMCPEACCGKPVTECACGPDCKHCDCHAKNKMNESYDEVNQSISGLTPQEQAEFEQMINAWMQSKPWSTDVNNVNEIIDFYNQARVKSPTEILAMVTKFIADNPGRDAINNEDEDLGNLIKTGVKGSYQVVAKAIKDYEELIRNNPNHPKVPQVKAELAKLKPMLAKAQSELGETTVAGDVAAVANPPSANAKIKRKNGAPVAPQKKNKDGTAKNALELGNNLMGGGTVKR